MEDTNEIVTKLYAIRAGMCVLAGEKEKSDGILAQAQAAYDAKMKAANGDLSALQSKLDDAEMSLYDSEELEDSRRSDRNHIFVNFLRLFLWGLLSLVLLSVLLALAGATLYLLASILWSLVNYIFHLDYAIYESVYGWYFYGLASMGISEGWMTAIFFLGPIVFGGLTVGDGFLMYYLFIDEQVITEHLTDALSDFGSSFSALFSLGSSSRSRRRAARIADSAKGDYQNAENRYKDEEQRLKAELAQAKRKSDLILINAMVFYSALGNLYGNFLHTQDWRFVDYLIYSFNTGRAESLKEALQLADREDQTQRIIETMQEITRKICETIKYNADRLQENLDRNFQMISDRVAEESQRICGQISEVGVKIDRVNANLQQMQIAQGVQTAYLAKISSHTNFAAQMAKHESETSSKLASDMGLMREDFRRVNSLH